MDTASYLITIIAVIGIIASLFIFNTKRLTPNQRLSKGVSLLLMVGLLMLLAFVSSPIVQTVAVFAEIVLAIVFAKKPKKAK